MANGLNMGWVVSFSRKWVRGTRPIKISVIVERPVRPVVIPAELIARKLVVRACWLLKCRPRDLVLKSHPADGIIFRRWDQLRRRTEGRLNDAPGSR